MRKMNFIYLLLILINSLLIRSTDYHGYLYDINDEYLSGDFIFDESKLPLNTSQFTSLQLRNASN